MTGKKNEEQVELAAYNTVYCWFAVAAAKREHC